MVREIIHVQVGQCGNQVGNSFWEAITQEHRIDVSGKNFEPQGDQLDDACVQNMGVFYHSITGGTYVPRAVCVDLEPGTVDVIKASPVGTFFKPDNFVFGASGAGNNWAKGHYTEGAELIEETLDVIRKEIETCDVPQGFQLFHSLGGGTGSGMGTLCLLKIRDTYPDRVTVSYSVFPSPKVSDTVVEPYNATLSAHQLLENCDQTNVVDNEALYNIAHNVLKKNAPTYADLNNLITRVTLGATSSLRFPGKLNSDLRKLGVNLVPFPRLHFFLIAHAPLEAETSAAMNNNSVMELSAQVVSARNFFSNVKPDDGKYMAAAFIYRGTTISTSTVTDALEGDQQNGKKGILEGQDFVEWIPNNSKSSVINVPPCPPVSGRSRLKEKSVSFIANTTALRSLFSRIATQFGAMYKRKAFLHWYKGEGMDEMEFQEADKNVRDLITEYQDKQDAVVEEEDGVSE